MRVLVCMLILVLMPFSPARAQTPGDIVQHPKCSYCDMNRQHFAHSRMLTEYSDGTSFGSCSLHCAAINLSMNIDKTPVSLMVADYGTLELIDAESAYWVIGGNRPGVMTKKAKWAFARKKDAESFVAQNGGKIGSFDDAIKAAYEDMYEDSKMIRGKRKIWKMHQ